MADYDFMKMTAEEIENLFLTTEMHPTSGPGKAALQSLAIKYKRMDVERSRRALWISFIALAISLVGLVVNALGAEKSGNITITIVNFAETEEYLKWNDYAQTAFATGFMCGLFVAPLYVQTPSQSRGWLSGKEISNIQVAAVIKKYIEEHPEKWHEPLNIVAFTALEEAFNTDAK